tara:strand:+ start:556 stop:765 length:210 start_codon:yes stop_codon:yes gene_type:complete
MKINEIIKNNMTEDDAATQSGDIATLAMPLFGKEKAIRRAVDPMGYLKGSKKKKQPGYPKKVKNIYSKK